MQKLRMAEIGEDGTECTECGEHHDAQTACRSGAEILADYAPPADYAAKERARRVASRDSLDDFFRSLGR